jgi:elongation factor P
MYATNDFKKGLALLVDDSPYTVVDFQHVKPGKGNQFTRCKLRNLLTGQLLERTFKSGEKFGIADVMFRDMTYLYKDESGFNFMDPDSYDQVNLNPDLVGESANFMTENLKIKVCFYNDRAVGLELPTSVTLKVTYTEPGHKGNTVTNTYKGATLETGYVVQVPMHTNEGDILKIDTRTGEYVERVSIG